MEDLDTAGLVDEVVLNVLVTENMWSQNGGYGVVISVSDVDVLGVVVGHGVVNGNIRKVLEMRGDVDEVNELWHYS